MTIAVNTRVLAHRVTGVERYTLELLQRFGDSVERIAPQSAIGGIKGHAWEQMVLPRKLEGQLLWSPANTGPLAVKNQVVTIHDVVPLEHPEWLNPRFAAWYRFLMPRLARRVRKVITVSNYSRDRLVALTGIPREKVAVIANGVDPRFFNISQEQIIAARNGLNLPPGRYVLSLGSVEPRKNLPRLIEAWTRIANRIPSDISLVIAGARNARVFAAAETGRRAMKNEQRRGGGFTTTTRRHDATGDSQRGSGGKRRKLEITSSERGGDYSSRRAGTQASWQVDPAGQNQNAALPGNSGFQIPGAKSSATADAPPRIYYLGHVADSLLPGLYAGALAFAYPSLYEGFGLPPLEAMAAGVPVLTGDLTSLPEVIGDAGIMVNPLDVDALANGLVQLIENQELRNRLSAAGVNQAKQFTWDKAAEETLAVLGAASQEEYGV